MGLVRWRRDQPHRASAAAARSQARDRVAVDYSFSFLTTSSSSASMYMKTLLAKSVVRTIRPARRASDRRRADAGRNDGGGPSVSAPRQGTG